MKDIDCTNVPRWIAEASAHPDSDAGQLLDGAKAIQRYLVYLGLTEMTEKRVFNWAADGRLPVKKLGNRLIANKRTLLRHFGIEGT
jgi:hypothetical protein